MANIWKTNMKVLGEHDAVQRFISALREPEAWKDTWIDNPIDSARYPGVEFCEDNVSIYTRHSPCDLFRMLEQRSAKAPAVTLKVGFYDLSSFFDCDYLPYYKAVIKGGVFSEEAEDKIFNVSNIAEMLPELVQADPVLAKYVSENAEYVAAERLRIESRGQLGSAYVDSMIGAVPSEES